MTARIRWTVVKARTVRPPALRWASWAKDHWRAMGRLGGQVKHLGCASKPVLPDEVEPFLAEAAKNLLKLGEAPEFIPAHLDDLRRDLTARLLRPDEDVEQALRERVRAAADQLKQAREELRTHLQIERSRLEAAQTRRERARR